jgi:IS30 family transposase
MSAKREMTIDERRKYVKVMKARYEQARRQERGQLLSEMEAVTGLHRKSLLRLLHAPSLARQKRPKGRGRSYGKEVETVILRSWESLDYVCAERLTPVLLVTARQLAKFGEVQLSAEAEEHLAQISRATVSRLLRAHRSQRHRLPQKGAERANQATKGVPMGRIPWDVAQPGHCEVDLVHHSGNSSAGEYAHTLQLIDVKTGWSERVAVMGRGQQAMEAGFRHILGRIPFAIEELHPDNGSEFFNHHLRRFWGEKAPQMKLSRSRPYQKNDNLYVEQKNDTLVRQYFGDLRFETAEHWPRSMPSMNSCGSTTTCFSR